MWQKFSMVKSACRKMLGIWMQVNNPQKSGWAPEDYKKAAKDQWRLRDPKNSSFEFWHVFERLEPLLTHEDQTADLLDDVKEDSA